MEQLVIIPLEEWYETIEMRTTNLENYNMCPFKYKFEPKKADDYQPFVFGKKVHTICQAYLLSRKKGDDEFNATLRDKLVDLMYKQYPEGIMVKEATEKTPALIQPAERFRTYINILEQHYADDEFMIAEFSLGLDIHMGKYLIKISWSLDLVTTEYSTVDLKTAGKAWSDESVRDKLQKIIYLYGLFKLIGKEDIWFEYAVLRSDLKLEKNVKLQTIRTKLDIPAMEYILTDLATRFTYSIKNNVWPTSQWDHCWFCNLWPKSEWNKCPLFDKQPIWNHHEENSWQSSLPF